VYAYKHTPQQKEFTKISNYVQTQEHNKSITSVSIATFLSAVKPENKIYFTLGKGKTTAIVNIEVNKVSVVKSLPSEGTVSSIESKLIDKNISYEWLIQSEKPQSVLQTLLSGKVISFLFFAFVGYILLVTSGINIFSKEFQAIYPDDIKESFDDLIGYDDIKQESKQLLEIITQSNRYAEYGIDGTFNILFSGKAGTGKSKFALYLAKELDIPIVATTGSLDEIYVGSGAKKIRSIFKNAQKAAGNSEHKSAIVFIDEAQKMLRKRGVGNEEKWADDTANELLAYLDGVQSDSKSNIIVIMASNFDENSFEMDDAMLRRFRKKIHFRLPNLEERGEILTHYLDDISQKTQSIDIDRVAKNMSGMTPAIIESVVNESALLALRKESKVDTSLLMQALERMLVGDSNRETTQNKEKIREIVSVHEMGHFLVTWHRDMQRFSNDYEKVKMQSRVVKVSSESVSQIGALGFVLNENSDEMMLQSIEELEWEIRQLYGGLAAERVVFGKNGSTTGASNDIKKATKLLKHMLFENSVYEEAKLDHTELMMSEELVSKIQKKSAFFYNESYQIIEAHKELLCHLSQKLMEEWSLDRERLFELIAEYHTKKHTLAEVTEHSFGFLEEAS
ncbi:MAG: AAA family ATPase, partial [Campylobacterota bacterium]|nr:AAA family ATPase [Campylobacterota bacterium]